MGYNSFKSINNWWKYDTHKVDLFIFRVYRDENGKVKRDLCYRANSYSEAMHEVGHREHMDKLLDREGKYKYFYITPDEARAKGYTP